MTIFRLFGGFALLLFGRKLYWLFVGGIGFVVALAFATRVLQSQPQWMILILAILAGVVGALLAVFLQRIAIGLAGFLGGGYFLLSLLELLGVGTEAIYWLSFLLGGILGAVLIGVLFDWALILLSSLSGSMMIMQSIELSRPWMFAVLLLLFIFGFVVQAGLFLQEGRVEERVKNE